MDKKDRDLMMKIAKGLDEVKKALENKQDKPVHMEIAPVTNAQIGILPTSVTTKTNRAEPFMSVMTKFQMKGVETINEQNKVQSELKSFIMEFCRNAGVDELKLHFKENTP